MTGPWLTTTWYGGNTVQPEPRYRVLASTPAASLFQHEARVRRTAAGIEAEYLDTTTGKWIPFVGTVGRFPGAAARIPEALLARAEAEAAA